jgi:RNA polymerase sigma-70 factor (ECF subfamily)
MSGEAVAGSTARLNDLLDAIGEGDRPALEELCKLTQAKLYGVALRILRQPALADEAVRDAYLRIWHDASAYDARHSDPMIFVVAAARRAALGLIRKRSDADLEFAAKPPAVPQEEQGAPPPVLSAELKRLLASLAGLSGDLRRMLLLAYYDGWSRRALAAEFDAPLATVATWLRRSLSQLRGDR